MTPNSPDDPSHPAGPRAQDADGAPPADVAAAAADVPDVAVEAGGAGTSLPFPVVGIGASAGGLEALEALAKRLSPDRMAFVVVQHLGPGHPSMLGEILQR
ncbi:MAG TPA: chemotaxis protein CheB, partial [Polyangiaceae bacterium]|nr:chemotaxis protein CheB [Polyangiaceae bacterium]